MGWRDRVAMALIVLAMCLGVVLMAAAGWAVTALALCIEL